MEQDKRKGRIFVEHSHTGDPLHFSRCVGDNDGEVKMQMVLKTEKGMNNCEDEHHNGDISHGKYFC